MAFTVKAAVRTETGKNKVRRMRRTGNLPAVMYGHGDPSLMLTLSAHAFDLLLREIKGHSPIVDVEVDGQPPIKCVIKTMQRNPITGALLHVDFQKVHPHEKITMNVPVIVKGSAEGVRQGGMLDHVMRAVPVRATIDRIPEHFEVDVTHLKIGQSIHVKDLGRPELEYGVPLDAPIVTILSPRKLTEVPTAAAVAAAAEAAPAEPEVIKEKKAAEEEETKDEEKGKAKSTKEEKKK
ncbi:MAG: 50S ribosomal protein L25 [candidate division WOR-3 bacterium]